MIIKKSNPSSYHKIQSEYRQSWSELMRVQSMTNLSNTSRVQCSPRRLYICQISDGLSWHSNFQSTFKKSLFENSILIVQYNNQIYQQPQIEISIESLFVIQIYIFHIPFYDKIFCTSTIVKFSIKEFLEKQQKGENQKKVSQKENFISKIAPLKIEAQKSKNNSPRFRIKLVSSPQSTNRTTLSKSSYVSPLRQNMVILQKDFIYESQSPIQTNQIEKQQEECLSISNKSPTRLDNLQDKMAIIKSNNIALEQEKMLQEDIKPPKRSKKELKGCLLRALRKLKEMNLNTKIMLQKQIFSKKPYQKPNSQEFIHAVKLNQLEKVKQYLEKNKYIVFDFDYFNMTALHWSSKKGLYEMTEFLIKNHADVDAIDILNRTPLYLAIQENNIPIIELLLRNKAYPWSTSVTDLSEVVGNNKRIRKILTQIRRVDIINMWGEKRLKEELF